MQKKRKWILGGLGVLLAAGLLLGVHNRLQNARRDMNRTLCVHNLKMIAMALDRYADEHEDRYPSQLSQLYPKYLTNPQCLVCPEIRADNKKKRGAPLPFSKEPSAEEIDSLSSYTLVPGLTKADGKNTVIAYEKKDNHGGMGRSLLYIDGHGAWEPPENWRNGPPNATLPPGF